VSGCVRGEVHEAAVTEGVSGRGGAAVRGGEGAATGEEEAEEREGAVEVRMEEGVKGGRGSGKWVGDRERAPRGTRRGGRCGRCHVVSGVAADAEPPRWRMLIVAHSCTAFSVVGPCTTARALQRGLASLP